MKNFEIKNVDCHATLAMIEKRWGFPRRTLRALLGMTKSGQSGRSMIEMLGVLAIIGVLSVGGIAGYSKAMQKYRINKTIEQITLIAGNIRAFFEPQKNYVGVYCSSCNVTNGCTGVSGVDSNGTPSYAKNGCPIIKKAKILPDEMITLDSTGKKITAITNPFDGGVEIGYGASGAEGGKHGSDKKIFNIRYNNIPEEACIDILAQDWSDLGIKMIGAFGSNNGDNTASVPISINDATELCDGGVSFLEFVFDAKETWAMY